MPPPCTAFRIQLPIMPLTLSQLGLLAALVVGLPALSRRTAQETEASEALSFPVEEFVVAPKGPETGPRLKVRHTTLGLMDPEIPPESIMVSPDGRHLAYMSIESGTVKVYSDGVASEPFEGFRPESINYAPDGRTLTYMGVRGTKSYVVVGDAEYKYGRISTGGIRFSMDGSRYGFVGKRNANYYALIDGEEIGPYKLISKQPIKLSQNNEHYGFIATIDGKQVAVIDGKEGPSFDAIVAIRFSPGGEHCSYIGKRGAMWIPVMDGVALGSFDEIRQPRFDFSSSGTRSGLIVRKGRRYHVLLDGKLGKSYADCRNLSFSHDGSSVAYLASHADSKFPFLVLNGEELEGRFSKLTFSPSGGSTGVVRGGKGKQRALINGVEGPAYDVIEAPGVVFSATGTHHLYTVGKNGQTVVVVDGKESPPFDKLGKVVPEFLPGSENYIYSIEREDGETLVFNGKQSPTYARFSKPAFSRDSGRVICAAEKGEGRWVAYVDGKEYGPEGERIPGKGSPTYFTVRNPIFDPEGKHVAYFIYSTDNGPKCHVVRDGVVGPAFDDVLARTIQFSPDGKHLVYVAGSGEHRYIVVDGIEISSGYTGFLRTHGFTFEDSNRVHIIASRQARFVLVEIEIES
ncbi:MAG: hypothetical protein CMJ89_19545 [Planctomycetes bacterium]|nr:hypothetical protein [Planctomycetota bacterium]